METVDVLFVHVPKLSHCYRPIDQFISVNFLPVGLLGLADGLHRERISTEVVHLGVEWIEDPQFSVLGYIGQKNPRVVAIDLHWHEQSFGAIELTKQIKAAFPHAFVLIGGVTASFFHEEIMRSFETVDGIIRGEAEVPVLELVRALFRNEEDLFSVPNLTWRRKGRILINPLSYVAGEEDLDRLCLNNFRLLKNYRTYIHHAGQIVDVKGGSKGKKGPIDSPRSPIYHLSVGRGCPVQCTWCSGNIPSQLTITGRKSVTYRGTEAVLRTIQEALCFGYDAFQISFDPSPEDPGYFLKLFSRIREEGIKMECSFEAFGLPKAELIKAFKETFPGPRSFITLSPDAGTDRLRKIHKGHPYTNQALMDCLECLDSHGVFCDLYFTVGLPFETAEDLRQTRELQRRIWSRYPHVRAIHTSAIEMEPGSPWHVDPEAFGVVTELRHFIDYYRYHSGKGKTFSSLGYWLPDHFVGAKGELEFEKKLQRIKQGRFGFLHSDSRGGRLSLWGRRLCDLSHLLVMTKGLTGRRRWC